MSATKEIKKEGKKQGAKIAAIIISLILLILALTVGLAYVASRMLTGRPLIDAQIKDVPQTSITPVDTNTDADGTTDGEGELVTADAQLWNTSEVQARNLYTEFTSTDGRLLSLPENGLVNYEYFRSALFIGDSLTQGFGLYPPLKDIATVAGFKGIGPREIVSNYEAQLQTGERVMAWDYICSQTPHSIYIGVGTNSLVAMPEDEAFMKFYGDFLDALKTQFPDVDIYVQSITPVTAATSEARPTMSNDRIDGINNQIAQLAVAKGMYYLDVHEALADENGCLREDIASGNDGYHMRDSTGYEIWVDYLARHVISSEYNAQFLTEAFNA